VASFVYGACGASAIAVRHAEWRFGWDSAGADGVNVAASG